MIPPKANAAFVACMEDLLDLYAEAYDPLRPVICMDEMPVGLVWNAREPLPVRPGSPAKEDYEYIRNGSASIFGALDLKGGARLLEVRQTRNARDFAHFLKRLADQMLSQAYVIRLVLDNLSTHTKGAFYQAFDPPEARRLASKFEFHYTPKHGSWLNAVELEFAAAKKQCLDRRIGDIDELTKQVQAWQDERNARKECVRWTFQTCQARTQLEDLYPTNEA